MDPLRLWTYLVEIRLQARQGDIHQKLLSSNEQKYNLEDEIKYSFWVYRFYFHSNSERAASCFDLHDLNSLIFICILCDIARHWHPSPPTFPTSHPSLLIQGQWLISELLSPAAICSSRTENCYLSLCGRLEMELFIRLTLSCLFCAGFIIASAMSGRQYLSLVSCAATCLLFHWRWAWAPPIYHPLRGAPW